MYYKELVYNYYYGYLMEMKEKQSKMVNLKYDSLEIQDYLVDGNKNTELAKLIFKDRSLTLDIKLQNFSGDFKDAEQYCNANCVQMGRRAFTWGNRLEICIQEELNIWISSGMATKIRL